jgi:hypothetical protein
LLRNVDVLTAQLGDAAQLDDSDLLDRARQRNRVLVSQDEHLLTETARRQQEGIPFAGLIYAHQLGITIGRWPDWAGGPPSEARGPTSYSVTPSSWLWSRFGAVAASTADLLRVDCFDRKVS